MTGYVRLCCATAHPVHGNCPKPVAYVIAFSNRRTISVCEKCYQRLLTQLTNPSDLAIAKAARKVDPQTGL